ncbi:xanthine dehydrogenase family protein subunit M [Aliiroseovarius subalbicans]|uniref:FAD binding domain-containing protein n=1 Tax=Aliiroseovarius subalbicans TaxID=2925840 RepID=UPI001F5662C0|nr:xanthine dehydrogenase family protein subunit M [Aliiroseovarius subalbicans]MCI2398841.1 xanthine dehydrogenase family protein subunit M [Aliiroseovarius subalbicans]
MYEFDIKSPSKLGKAVRMLRKHEDAQVLGGGQTLIPTLKQRLAAPSVLVSLAKIDKLKGISSDSGTVTVGAGTCHADVAADDTISALSALAGGIGDPAVRNRGTIGGSLANNDPSACYPAAALGLGATIVTSARDIAADDYFQGLFETALDETEIITSVTFPIPDAAAYVKFDQPASRFALVGVFVSRKGSDVRVAVTGASEDGVFRWAGAEEALSANFAPEALDGLTPSGDMIGDIHGSPEYRAHLVGVMAKRAVAAC